MTNPWLHIHASDYENHMSRPEIAQQAFLAQIFQEALENHDTSSMALLGCTTGNGFEYIDCAATKRITAIDINPKYLEILSQRYKEKIPGLELVEADLEICTIEKRAYSFIFAGLLFEYLNPKPLLEKIAKAMLPNGVFVSILQLPSGDLPEISKTPCESIKALKSIMQLVSPQEFQTMAAHAGLRETEVKTITLKSGKSFCVGTYTKAQQD